MKIYIVLEHYWYSHTRVLGAFINQADAFNYVKDYCSHTDYEPWCINEIEQTATIAGNATVSIQEEWVKDDL